MVYSTCSLEPEENEQVIATVLAENPNTRLVPLESRIDELSAKKILTALGAERLHRCLTPEGYLQLIPGVLRTDGFSVAMLERTS